MPYADPMSETIKDRLSLVFKERPELSMRRVSLGAGLSEDIVKYILSGRVKRPRNEHIVQIAEYLGLNVRWLESGVGPKENVEYKEPIKITVDAYGKEPMATARFAETKEVPVFSATSKKPIGTIEVPPDIAMMDDVAALLLETAEMGDAGRIGDRAVYAPYPRPIPGDDVVIIQTAKNGDVTRLMRRLVRENAKSIVVEALSPTVVRSEYDKSKIEWDKVVAIKKR